jgi:hypothetical protein
MREGVDGHFTQPDVKPSEEPNLLIPYAYRYWKIVTIMETSLLHSNGEGSLIVNLGAH